MKGEQRKKRASLEVNGALRLGGALQRSIECCTVYATVQLTIKFGRYVAVTVVQSRAGLSLGARPPRTHERTGFFLDPP